MLLLSDRHVNTIVLLQFSIALPALRYIETRLKTLPNFLRKSPLVPL